MPNWDGVVQNEADVGFGHNILINLESPIKITFIAIEILEPRSDKHWATGDIRIREARLFSKYWKVNIK